MSHGKFQMQKYEKIRQGTKNVRNPHILRTLVNLHFFEVLKFFFHIICLGYYLNRLIALRRCFNESEKNPNPKILKN